MKRGIHGRTRSLFFSKSPAEGHRQRETGGRFASAALRAILALACAAPGPARAEDTFYLERGSLWRYLPGTREASSPDPAAWRALDFDDSDWAEGPAPFGYGDPPYGTELPDMRSNYSSLYLRQVVEIPEPEIVATLLANAAYDDGFVLWINGVEVLRANVPGKSGEDLPHDATAERGREARTYVSFKLPDPDGYIRKGPNIVCVHAFNSTITSTDFKFDLELVDPFGPDRTPPKVERITPAPGILLRSLQRIEIVFSEEVQGVDAGDLMLDGKPALAVERGAGPAYVFQFEPPEAGTVEAAWVENHGIRDFADPPNLFAGGRWSYRIDPKAPLPDVVVSEVLAVNLRGLADEDRERSDWIEIENRGSEPVDLSGWALSDDPGDLGKWVFPQVVLEPGARAVVFASGKDRREPGLPLHTNFKLNNTGEFLALSTPDSPRAIASGFVPRFPEQRPDISYGLDAEGRASYFDPPTPGEPNDTALSIAGITAPPVPAVPHGFYDEPFLLDLLNVTPGAEIYYTLDGTEPTREAGVPYTGPIEIAGTPARAVVTLRARAFKEGFLPSRTVTRTYIFAEDVLAQPAVPEGFPRRWGSAPSVDYEIDPEVVTPPAGRELFLAGLRSLPVLSVVMDTGDLFGTRGIYSNPQGEGLPWERACSAEFIDSPGGRSLQIDCGIRIFGGASRNPDRSPKHSFRLLFKGAYGPTKLSFPLFAGSPVEEFDTISLRANYNNSWIHWDSGQRRRGSMIRDQWARDAQLEMSGFSSYGTYMHLFLNGLYWGVYNVVERPSAPFAASHLGGEKEEYDALNSGAAVDGDTRAWTGLMQAVSRGVRTLDEYLAVAGMLDLPHFADYMLMNFYGANADWPSHNWYAVRRRIEGAKWRFVSWDAERILEGVSDDRTSVSDGNSPGIIFQRLRSHPEFQLLFADRVHRHLFGSGALTPERAAERWERRARELDAAVKCEEARWGDYRRDVHRSSNGPYEFYRRETHWLPERNRLLAQYFPRRTQFLLARLTALRLYPRVGAPVPQSYGGIVEPGFLLELSLPEGTDGTILYTTDGTDPRVFGTGEASPAARAYEGPIAVIDRLHLKARTLAEGGWSALLDAVYTVLAPGEGLVISEIMYNPPGGPDYEFVEIHNTLSLATDLFGVRLAGGIEFAFPPGASIPAGGYAIVAASAEAFAERYGDVPIAGVFRGNLDNAGDRIEIRDPQGRVAFEVEYDDEDFWPLGPDGFGFSLVLADSGADPRKPRAWRASALEGGSPGAPDPEPAHGGLVVSEVLTNSTFPFEDAIEIHNPTARTIDAGGWFLSDSRAGAESLRKFRIPDGTVLQPGGYAVFYEFQFNADPGSPTSFALSSFGDDVYLASADRDGNLTGYITGHSFRAAEEGVSFGRIETSAGPDFTALSARTFGADTPRTLEEFRAGGGAPNAEPRIGDVVLNEIHYHPQDGAVEFIELYNRGEAAADLYDAALGRGWRLDGVRNAAGTDAFEFPEGTAIAPGAYLLVVPVDPQVFRELHSLPAATPVAGPYGGALANGGERIRLARPVVVPDGEEPAWIDVDSVRYGDEAPWPEAADGAGPSLERVRADRYGNDPANWAASLLAGGTPGRKNSTAEEGPRGGGQIPGDATQDGRLNISDAVAILRGLFGRGGPPPCGGETIGEGGNRILLDLDRNDRVDLNDAVHVLNYLFRRGPQPAGGTDCIPIPGCPEVCAP